MKAAIFTTIEAFKAIPRIWTLPNTIIGLVLGFWNYNPATFKVSYKDGFYLFENEGGFAKWNGNRGFNAITFGNVIISEGELYPLTEKHELYHAVKQYYPLGPLFLPIYGVEALIFGYDNMPIENAAYDNEDKMPLVFNKK